MSLRDLGKNDISEETQALKDRLASRDTENAGLRTQLMRREAELQELQLTLSETVYKLSKEAERALSLEGEISTRSSELKTERISLQNTELALQSAQEKLKAEERAKKELESALDTVSLHSQANSAEHQSVQREKRALESRVRELERIVQTHEAKGASNMSRRIGRPRSSSVSSFRLPAMEQELNDARAQLHVKDKSLCTLEQKLARAQDDLVKAENARISIDKASQKRLSELSELLERREEELESLRGTDNTGEREQELLKRIDEDAAKIVALEKSVAESQGTWKTQARIQKLQSQLKAECEKAHRCEDLQNRLLHEKEELVRHCEASRRQVAEGHELLMTRDRQIRELEAGHAHLLAELDTHKRPPSLNNALSQSHRPDGIQAFHDESALADHIQILLQAIDRLRDERDSLKRALEFSEVEYRVTTESFQSQITSLTNQLMRSVHNAAADKSSTVVKQRMKQLTSCAAAFTVVISHLQTHLDLAEARLSTTSAGLTSSSSQLHDALAYIDSQKQSLATNAHAHDILLQKLDVAVNQLAEADKERSCLRLQLVDANVQVAVVMERAKASEAAREEAHQIFLLAEQRVASLNNSHQGIQSERNSLALQVTSLQGDLARVRKDLAGAENRYEALHSQQLSSMSTSEVVRTLKDRIKELEVRIVHCTDQIADYQHDIRRLEANAKLHEERVAEMTSELELLASQKEAMVEDCAEARGARDEAIEKLEAAEDDAEQIQQQLQHAKEAHEAELSAMSSMVAKLTADKQQTTAHLTDAEAEKAGFVGKLDSLGRHHRHLSELLHVATSRSQSLELESSRATTEMQQAIIFLATIHRLYKDCARRLRGSRQHITSLELQLDTLTQEAKQNDTLIDNMEEEKHVLLQRLSDASTAGSQNDLLRNSLQEKDLELVAARQLLEETQSRYTEIEAKLMERTTAMDAQAGRVEDITSLQAELESVRTRLYNSLENFADLDKLHGDVIQDFTTVKEGFERRLTETDEQIRRLESDHEHSVEILETKYRHEADILVSNLEDREHEVDQLRQQLQDMSDAHTQAETKLYEELKSCEASLALANDMEKDLRRSIADMCQRLSETEAESRSQQEERQTSQAQITSLHAEIQRSTSLARYLESQVREIEDTCMQLRESLQRSELTLAESEKAAVAAEFNLTLQATQHEKVVSALRREIVSLQSGPELRSALADLEEKNREMDNLLRAKSQEIEEYDDRILETLKANKKLTNRVESLTRKMQALQAKLSSMKIQPQEPAAESAPPRKATSASSPPVSDSVAMHAGSYTSSSHVRESSAPSLTWRTETPEPLTQPVVALHPSRTPGRASEPPECEVSAGKKRPAPDDDERDSVPAEGHYSTDAYFRNGPTPRLRRAHGHPGGFTPVRGASLRKAAGTPSPGRRTHLGMAPSEIITDVTNSPRGPPGGAQLKKKGWLGKIRGGGTGSQPPSSRLGAFGGQ